MKRKKKMRRSRRMRITSINKIGEMVVNKRNKKKEQR